MSASIPVTARATPLPVTFNPLLGRDADIDHLRDLLDDPAVRLVTITGPGGVGKTRLALHVASTLRDAFGDAITFVPLASIRDPAFVLPAITHEFGVYGDDPEAQLVERLRDAPALLVLDNLEQVTSAAPALIRVLERCPHLTMLVTSRVSLGIPGEQLYPLAPLPSPPHDASTAEIERSATVQLFVQRAHALNPTFVIDDGNAVILAEICRRLDGLPLAIELAASRTAILSPAALLARLSDRLRLLGHARQDSPDRQRTMRNAIAWSYDLLTPDEQRLMRRMSVYSGGISFDAIEAIVDSGDSGRDAFDVLGALVNHSLVRPQPSASGDARFLMLETIRAFGLEQLASMGEEDDARLAHATGMVVLSEAAEPHLTTSDQKEWIDRLDPDTENLRAAVDWSLANGHEEIALRIGASNWRFCSTRGLASDCLARLEQALAAPASATSPYRANALVGAGNLAEDLHDLDKAQGYFTEARECAIMTGNRIDECHALIGLGAVAHDRGAYAEAFAWHEQTAALAHEIGDRRSSALAVSNMASVYFYQGKLDDAERCWLETCEVLEELGDTTTEAIACSNLGSVSIERGDFARAEERLNRAMTLQRQVMASRDIPFTLINLGEVWCRLGDYRRSHDAFAEGIALFRQASMTIMEGIALNAAAMLALCERDIARAASLVLESSRIAGEAGNQRCIVDNAEVLAAICAHQGDHASAVELMAAAAGIRTELGAGINPLKAKDLKRIEVTTQAALGQHAYARAWEEGNQIGLDALVRRIGTVGRNILDGEPSASPEAGAPTPAGDAEPEIEHNLTARELDVLKLLAQGRSTAEISETLFISPRTTTTHVTHILGKLGVTSRTAAVVRALHLGLV